MNHSLVAPPPAPSAVCRLLLFWLWVHPLAAAPTPDEITDILTQDVNRFTQLLASPLAHQRLQGTQGLSDLKHWESEQALAQRLADADPEVQQAAVQALGRLGTSFSVPYLIQLLEDPSWLIRQEAWLGLGRLTGQSFPPNAKEAWLTWWDNGSVASREQELLAAAQAVPQGAPHLTISRRKALRALRHLATPAAEPALLDLLRQRSNLVLSLDERTFIAETLERIGSTQAVEILAREGTDAAAWALGRLDGPDAIAALAHFRPTLPVLLALDRLRFTNAGPYVPFLVGQMGLITYRSQPDDVMNAEDQPMQRVAANLIRRSGQAPLLVERILQELENSMDPPLPHGPRPAAPESWETMLREMQQELKPGFVRNDGLTTSQPLTALSHLAEDPALVPRLIPLLRHPAFVARVYVGLTLGRLHATQALPEILAILREGYPFSDATALASGKHFDQSQTVRWRGFLCIALGRLGGNEARHALEQLASNPAQPRDIRYSSVLGLRFIAAPQSVDVLHRIAQEDIIWMVRHEAREVAAEIVSLQE